MVGVKNKHMIHFEDLAFYRKDHQKIFTIVNELKEFSIDGKTPNISVKWDGAPSIFVGCDPSDGKFFVAKKSIFNKIPIVYKSLSEVDNDPKLPNNLKIIFTKVFSCLGHLEFDGVVQGDFLFTNENLTCARYNDKLGFSLFHPNTIVYAYPENLSKYVIGVAWHTFYQGPSLDKLEVTVRPNTHPVNDVSKVFSVDTNFKDFGLIEWSRFDKKRILELSDRITTALYYDSFVRDLFRPEPLIRFINHTVRENIKFSNYMQKKISFLDFESKRGTSKCVYRDLDWVFKLHEHLTELKMIFINKLNSVSNVATFIKADQGFKKTDHEGYVLDDHMVKLVDRREFSYNNFSDNVKKGWSRT